MDDTNVKEKSIKDINVEDDDALASSIDTLFKKAQSIVGGMGEMTSSKSQSPYQGALDLGAYKSIEKRDLEMLRLMTELGENNKEAYERIEKKLNTVKNSVEELGDMDDEEVVMGIIAIKNKLEALENQITALDQKQLENKEENLGKLRILFGQSKNVEKLVIISLIASLAAALTGIASIILTLFV